MNKRSEDIDHFEYWKKINNGSKQKKILHKLGKETWERNCTRLGEMRENFNGCRSTTSASPKGAKASLSIPSRSLAGFFWENLARNKH